MVATSTGPRIKGIADDLFGVVTQFCLAIPRSRRRNDDLTEVEFLTLAILHHRGTMTVGDILRLLGVLPTQMSRIIRALDNRPDPLVTCRINPQDRRKINVCLTKFGAKAFREYQAVRVRRIVELLHDLPAEDQEGLTGLLDKVRGLLERGANGFQ
jgi:DNA-binding MarR family transcriptional regulator